MPKTWRSRRRAGSVAAIALIMSAGVAPASTFGTITTSGGNDGLNTIYGSSSRSGWFGSNVSLEGALSNLTITYLGSQSALNLSFWYQDVQLFQTGSGTDAGIFNSAGFGSTTIPDVPASLLGFFFQSPAGTAANGSNPDGSLPDTYPNFFATFCGNENSASGNCVDLWFDGADGNDDNDDMVVRLSSDNGNFSVEVTPIPVPATIPLLASGLALLSVFRRGKAKQEGGGSSSVK